VQGNKVRKIIIPHVMNDNDDLSDYLRRRSEECAARAASAADAGEAARWVGMAAYFLDLAKRWDLGT